MQVTFRHEKISTKGMACDDRKWAIYCPELEAWIKTWGKNNVVFTSDPQKIDKNARRNTSQQLGELTISLADKWRRKVDEGDYRVV